jgi:hypothetical protein
MQGDAVGCEAELAEAITPQLANVLHKRDDILSHRRLATCQADLRDALRDEEGGQV